MVLRALKYYFLIFVQTFVWICEETLMFKQSLEELACLTPFKTSWEEIESRKLFFLNIISGLLRIVL